MIHLSENELKTVQAILGRFIPDKKVVVFGSRLNATKVKPFSDLDLCIMGKPPLSLVLMAELKEAFSESDLPFRIDVLNYFETSEEFQKIIDNDHEYIQ